MSTHLFGSVTLPDSLGPVTYFYRLPRDRGYGGVTVLDGWRRLLVRTIENGPLELVSSAAEHISHFGAAAPQAVRDLLESEWPEAVALGVACASLQAHAVIPGHRVASLPAWVVELESRTLTQACVRFKPDGDGPIPWILEMNLGRAAPSSISVWINGDGSLYQLYPTDDPIDEHQTFLRDIDHMVPNLAFEPVEVAVAVDAIRPAIRRSVLEPGDRALLDWLVRSSVAPG